MISSLSPRVLAEVSVVPTYEYMCTACGEQTEAVQKFTDDPLTECPNCGGTLRKLFSSVGIVFKGSGFYRNDSRERAKVGAGSSSSESSSSSSDGSAGAADSSPSTASTGAAAAAPSSGSESTSSSATTPATPSTTSAGKPAAPKPAANGSKPKSGGSSKPTASS